MKHLKILFVSWVMLLPMTLFGNETAHLSIEPFTINANGEAEMLIDLVNPDEEITLVQFDMHLPSGLSLKKNNGEFDIDIAGRTTYRNHSLDANENSGSIRFLLSSTKNAIISGTSGAIIKAVLVADANFVGGHITIDNILLVSPDAKETKPNAIVITISGSQPETGTASLSIEEFFYYGGKRM